MSMIEKVAAIQRLVNGESGSATLPENWEALLATKQDTLIAGDGVDIVNNTVSMTRGIEQVFGPPAISDNAQQYGWYGTLQMLGLPAGTTYLLTEVAAYRRQGSTTNGNIELYMRILRKNINNVWRVAYQSPVSHKMNSYILEGEAMPWPLLNVDGKPYIPTDENIFICWVSSRDATANTAIEVGFKPTTEYRGLYHINSGTIPLTPSNPYNFGMALRVRAYVEPPISLTWDEVTNKPSTFPPEGHTHQIENVSGLQEALDGKQTTLIPGNNITIDEDGTISATGGGEGGVDLEAVKTWVNGQGTDANGNISRTNLNNRGTSISDTKYVSSGGTITDILASVTNEGVTPAQVQSIVDANGNVGLSSNITTTENTGAKATVRARHINPTTGAIAHVSLVADANGEVKVVVTDSTGTLTMTPLSIESGQGSRVVLGSSDAQCAVIANEAAPYIVLRTGDINGSNEENLSLFVNQDVTGGPALQLNGQRGTTDLRDNSWTLTSGDAQIKLETSEDGTVQLTLTDSTGSLTLTPSSVLGGNTDDSGSTGNYLPLTGGELTGRLTFPSTTGLSRTTTVTGDAITLSGIGAAPVSLEMTPFGLQLINSTSGPTVVAEIGLDSNVTPYFRTTKTSDFADGELIPKSYVDTAISDILGDINTLLESI